MAVPNIINHVLLPLIGYTSNRNLISSYRVVPIGNCLFIVINYAVKNTQRDDNYNQAARLCHGATKIAGEYFNV
jgi:hypothetical protein